MKNSANSVIRHDIKSARNTTLNPKGCSGLTFSKIGGSEMNTNRTDVTAKSAPVFASIASSF